MITEYFCLKWVYLSPQLPSQLMPLVEFDGSSIFLLNRQFLSKTIFGTYNHQIYSFGIIFIVKVNEISAYGCWICDINYTP